MIGPNADAHRVLYANYNGIPSHPVSILEGIKAKLQDTRVLYSKGCELKDDPDFKMPIPTKYLFTPDKKAGLLSSYYPTKNFAGQPLHIRVEKQIALTDEFGAPFKDLQINNFSVRWEGFLSFPETALYKIEALARPQYKIYIDDKLIVDENHQAKYLKFEANKFHKIRIEFVSDGQEFYFNLVHSAENSSLLKNALKIAKRAQAVVLVVGLSNLLEEEGLDREKLNCQKFSKL